MVSEQLHSVEVCSVPVCQAVLWATRVNKTDKIPSPTEDVVINGRGGYILVENGEYRDK